MQEEVGGAFVLFPLVLPLVLLLFLLWLLSMPLLSLSLLSSSGRLNVFVANVYGVLTVFVVVAAVLKS